jgi:hypothetical protein
MTLEFSFVNHFKPIFNNSKMKDKHGSKVMGQTYLGWPQCNKGKGVP